ncbi:hypothetical protein HYS47_03965 [Candidatus Woesearchaeota archaeon]|nr:hypothetical protein [Candidatus Woesearchaeota archaeon]
MPFPRVTQQWAREVNRRLVSLEEELSIGGMLKDAVGHLRNHVPHTELYGRDEHKKTPFQDLEEMSNLLTELPKEHRTPKKERAWALFYGLRYHYGFLESLRTGDWVAWPGSQSMVNCYNQAIATFAAAQAAGLDPVLVEFIGLQASEKTNRFGHSLVVVNVADDRSRDTPEYWVIDQAMAMYGPVQFGEQDMVVENFAKHQQWRRTQRRDYQKMEFGFIQALQQDEEAIVAQMQYLEEHPKAVLYGGQRIGVPEIDAWQSQKPIRTGWFLKFISNDGDREQGVLASRIFINRPGIKSRGLEYQIHINDDGTGTAVTDERVVGYFCSGLVWSDFVDQIPLVTIPAKDIPTLTKGLSALPLEKRVEFEQDIMHQRPHAKDNKARIAAAQASYTTMRASEEYGDLVWAISAVEALYQHEKGEKESYLSPAERQRELKKLARANQWFDYYHDATRKLKKMSTAKKKILGDVRYSATHHLQLLHQSQLEDRRAYLFSLMDDQEEMLEYILQQKPTFIDEAVDRLVFYNRRIRGKEDRVEEMVQKAFGGNAGEAVAAGYRRIFAEFLGHIAVTEEQLMLGRYKEKVLQKLGVKQ